MTQGLKNLQTAARAHARRERLLDTSGHASSGLVGGAYGDPHHTDDSGIGIDDLEAEYDADGASDRSGGSASGYGGQGQEYGGGRQQYHHQGQRLPSMDMGIDSIINRPNGR